MVMLNTVSEQEVKPVGIAILSLTQVVGDRFRRVRQSKLTGCLVVLTDELIHLAIYTAGRCRGCLGIVEVAFLLQLLIDAHLVLRVHDIECRVAWLQSHRIFTCIVDMGLTRLTFLGRDDDDTCHGTSTIDGSRTTILQDLEALDIV